MKENGMYTILAHYGSSGSAKIEIEFNTHHKNEVKHIVKLVKDSSVKEFTKMAEPEIVNISEGDRVMWINEDSAAHTVTSGTISDGVDGVFDSSLLMAGNSYEVTFQKKGKYKYFCMVHPWKECTVIVK